MRDGRLAEFLTVLIFALVIGAGVLLAIRYLGNETARGIVLLALVTFTVVVWQYLRRRFGRP